MKKSIIPLLIVSTALISGCDQKGATTSSAPAVAKADAVAEVNGQYIAKSTLAELEKEIAERSHGQTFPKEKLIEELTQRELLVQDAIQKLINVYKCSPDDVKLIEKEFNDKEEARGKRRDIEKER